MGTGGPRMDEARKRFRLGSIIFGGGGILVTILHYGLEGLDWLFRVQALPTLDPYVGPWKNGLYGHVMRAFLGSFTHLPAWLIPALFGAAVLFAIAWCLEPYVKKWWESRHLQPAVVGGVTFQPKVTVREASAEEQHKGGLADLRTHKKIQTRFAAFVSDIEAQMPRSGQHYDSAKQFIAHTAKNELTFDKDFRSELIPWKEYLKSQYCLVDPELTDEKLSAKLTVACEFEPILEGLKRLGQKLSDRITDEPAPEIATKRDLVEKALAGDPTVKPMLSEMVGSFLNEPVDKPEPAPRKLLANDLAQFYRQMLPGVIGVNHEHKITNHNSALVHNIAQFLRVADVGNKTTQQILSDFAKHYGNEVRVRNAEFSLRHSENVDAAIDRAIREGPQNVAELHIILDYLIAMETGTMYWDWNG